MVNLNLFDPFTSCYSTINLHEDFWWQAQHDEEFLSLSESVRRITHENDGVASIEMCDLIELETNTAMNAGLPTLRIQDTFYENSPDPAHWTALCVSMLSHTMLEIFHKEKLYRFYKSPGQDIPFFGPNVATATDHRGYVYKYPKGGPKPQELIDFETTGTYRKKKQVVEEPQLSLF